MSEFFLKFCSEFDEKKGSTQNGDYWLRNKLESTFKMDEFK